MNLWHFDYSNMRQVILQAIIIVCFGIATGLMFNYPLLIQSMKTDAPLVETSPVVPEGDEHVKGRP